MSHRKHFPFLLLLFATVFLLGSNTSRACSCGPNATVLNAYNGSDVVVIVRAVAIEKSADGKGVDGVRATTMIVQQVFKGAVKVGSKMTFDQGGGADCIWTFNDQSIDKEFLFYLHEFKELPNSWIAVTCGRSSPLEYANDDLLYLRNMSKLRGRTRISGTFEWLSDSDQSLVGLKVRILGANKNYETKTDEHGVYEIYDLPAGKYLIEPEVPRGWRIDSFYLGYSPSFAGNDRLKAPKQIPIVLEAKRHAGLDIHFEFDNAVSGRVYDPSGQPLNGVCLDLFPADAQVKEHPYLADCTEHDGAFSIERVPPGSYVLVLNDDGKISSREPFRTLYYPNVFERAKAAVITISLGETIKALNIHIPETEETITVTGAFLYADGKPVIDERVEFKAEQTPVNADGEAAANTDAQGRFSIKILKGLKGRLFGAMYTYEGEFENCPKLDKAIKEAGDSAVEIKTPALQINADFNQYDVELKYPFPGCKKAKH